MIIKVCGMRDPENIRAVNELGVDLIGMIFDNQSPRFVSLINSHAGIIPDRVEEHAKESLTKTNAKFVGVFVDEMPQTVVTNVYNFNLDYVQLNGEESAVYIDNLRATLDPDIHSGIQIIKEITLLTKDDINKAKQYEGHADMLLFDIQCKTDDDSNCLSDWSVLADYNGNLQFLLSGNIGPEDVARIKAFHHPKCVGINVDEKFEIQPAIKDVDKLKDFVGSV